MMMNVSVRVPSTIGEAWNEGAAITVNSGTCRCIASWLRIFRNIVAREQTVPGLLRDDANGQAVLGICSRKAVLHENVSPLQIALQAASATS